MEFVHHTPTSATRRLRANSAFTIAEVMMATFVMALGLSTSIITLQSGFRAVDVSRGNTLASQILQSEIERIRLMSWTAVTDATTMMGDHKVDLKEVFDTNNVLASKYTLVRTVTDDSTRSGQAVNISLQVTWKSYDGQSRKRSFQTIYVKNGLYDYYYTLAGPPPSP